jgi:hypothetical protein
MIQASADMKARSLVYATFIFNYMKYILLELFIACHKNKAEEANTPKAHYNSTYS